MPKRPDLILSYEQRDAISQRMRELKDTKIYTYPWHGLEDDLAEKEPTGLWLLAYGSLVSRTSAAHTLRPGQRAPAIAFGVRRLFNYEIPVDHPRYGSPANELARGALNVVFTGNREDMVNGIMIDTALDDIQPLREREIGYDLRQVACIHWDKPREPPLAAYILECPDEPRDGKVRTNAHIEPHLEYYKICRGGAAKTGDDFLEFWLSSTYLADAETTIDRWEAKAKQSTND